MASFQKSLDLDSLTVNQIFTSGNNNTNSVLPAYRVLTTDGLGGTSWMTLSTLQGGGAFTRINTTSAVFIADASATTFSIYDGENAGLSADPTAPNTVYMYAKAFGTIALPDGNTINSYNLEQNVITSNLRYVGAGGITIRGNPQNQTITFDGANLISSAAGVYSFNQIAVYSNVSSGQTDISTSPFIYLQANSPSTTLKLVGSDPIILTTDYENNAIYISVSSINSVVISTILGNQEVILNNKIVNADLSTLSTTYGSLVNTFTFQTAISTVSTSSGTGLNIYSTSVGSIQTLQRGISSVSLIDAQNLLSTSAVLQSNITYIENTFQQSYNTITASSIITPFFYTSTLVTLINESRPSITTPTNGISSMGITYFPLFSSVYNPFSDTRLFGEPLQDIPVYTTNIDLDNYDEKTSFTTTEGIVYSTFVAVQGSFTFYPSINSLTWQVDYSGALYLKVFNTTYSPQLPVYPKSTDFKTDSLTGTIGGFNTYQVDFIYLKRFANDYLQLSNFQDIGTSNFTLSPLYATYGYNPTDTPLYVTSIPFRPPLGFSSLGSLVNSPFLSLSSYVMIASTSFTTGCNTTFPITNSGLASFSFYESTTQTTKTAFATDITPYTGATTVSSFSASNTFGYSFTNNNLPSTPYEFQLFFARQQTSETFTISTLYNEIKTYDYAGTVFVSSLLLVSTISSQNAYILNAQISSINGQVIMVPNILCTLSTTYGILPNQAQLVSSVLAINNQMSSMSTSYGILPNQAELNSTFVGSMVQLSTLSTSYGSIFPTNLLTSTTYGILVNFCSFSTSYGQTTNTSNVANSSTLSSFITNILGLGSTINYEISTFSSIWSSFVNDSLSSFSTSYGLIATGSLIQQSLSSFSTSVGTVPNNSYVQQQLSSISTSYGTIPNVTYIQTTFSSYSTSVGAGGGGLGGDSLSSFSTSYGIIPNMSSYSTSVGAGGVGGSAFSSFSTSYGIIPNMSSFSTSYGIIPNMSSYSTSVGAGGVGGSAFSSFSTSYGIIPNMSSFSTSYGIIPNMSSYSTSVGAGGVGGSAFSSFSTSYGIIPNMSSFSTSYGIIPNMSSYSTSVGEGGVGGSAFSSFSTSYGIIPNMSSYSTSVGAGGLGGDSISSFSTSLGPIATQASVGVAVSTYSTTVGPVGGGGGNVIYNDSWIQQYLINAPSTINFGASISKSSQIFIPWTYPVQVNVGFMQNWVQNILAFNVILSTNVAGITFSTILNQQSTNIVNYRTANLPFITGITLIKTAGTSGVQSLTFPQDSLVRSSYVYYNTALANLNGNNQLLAWYTNYNLGSNVASTIFAAFLTAGQPSLPQRLYSTNTTSNSVIFYFSTPQFVDINDNTSVATISSYTMNLMAVPFSTFRYTGIAPVYQSTTVIVGAPFNFQTAQDGLGGQVVQYNATSLYPDSVYTFKVQAANSASQQGGIASTLSTVTSNLTSDATFSGTLTFASRYYASAFRVFDSLNVNTLVNSATAWTTSAFVSPIHTVAIRGKTFTGTLSISTVITSPVITPGAQIFYNGFPATTPSAVTLNNVTLTPTTVYDRFAALGCNAPYQGFFLSASNTVTLGASIFVANSTIYTLQTTALQSTSAGITTGQGTFSWYYDGSPGTAAITDAAFAYSPTTAPSYTAISGVQTVYGTATFSTIVGASNLGNYFYASPILSYTYLAGSASLTTTETTLARIISGCNGGALAQASRIGFSNGTVTSASLASTWASSIRLAVFSSNLAGNSATSNVFLSTIIDGPSYTLITTTLPAVLPTATTSATTVGCRIWSFSSFDGTNVYVVPFVYANAGNNSYTSYLYSHANSLIDNTVASIPASKELQVANGAHRTVGTSGVAYLNYAGTYYGNLLQNSINYTSITRNTTLRFATFGWKTTSSETNYTKVTFVVNYLTSGTDTIAVSNSLAVFSAGNFPTVATDKVFLFYRIEDQASILPTDAGSATTCWLDANGTTGNAASAFNYYNDTTGNQTQIYGGVASGATLASGTITFPNVFIPAFATSGKDIRIIARFGVPMNWNFAMTTITAQLSF